MTEDIQQELEELEKENEAIDDRTLLIKGHKYKNKVISNEHIIDFDPNNTGWNTKQNWYCVGVVFFTITKRASTSAPAC